MRIRVYYEDTDAGGVVFHSNYISYCERARSDVFFKRGMTPILEGGHFVARKLEADFLRSARLGDILEIKTELIEMRAASFRLLQTIYIDEKKIFVLFITLAYITFEGRVQKLDVDTKELILSLFEE